MSPSSSALCISSSVALSTRPMTSAAPKGTSDSSSVRAPSIRIHAVVTPDSRHAADHRCGSLLVDRKLSANWMAAAGHPGEDAALFDAVKAVGMDLCPALGISVPVGKDSLSMRTRWNQDGAARQVTAPVSLIVSAFASIGDVRPTLTPQLQGGDTTLVLVDLGQGKRRMGGSMLAQVLNQFGERVPDPESRRRIGFLPENPYVYPYLTPREFVELAGRLSGMGGSALRKRAMEVLDQVKIAYAADRPAHRLSKGMLQRTGLAAALVSEPEMLILDEPMSGLDPVGRKEVKDLIFSERDRGRTIFFSTHILGDVEAMCDRVAILREGKVVVSGAIRQLLRGDVLRTEITLAQADDALCAAFTAKGFELGRRPGVVVVQVEGEARVGEVLRAALDGGAQILEVTPRRETLEDLFLRRAL